MNTNYIPLAKAGSKSLKFLDRQRILNFYHPRVKDNKNNRHFKEYFLNLVF